MKNELGVAVVVRVATISLIGGSAGLLDTIVIYLAGRTMKPHNLALDFLINGLSFTIVGVGVVIALLWAAPELRANRTKSIVGGIVAGFCAGLFYHFWIGQYIGILIFCAVLSLIVHILGGQSAGRLFIGGVIGGFGSIFLNIIFTSIFPSMLSIIVYNGVNIYFLTFGMLVAKHRGASHQKGSGLYS